jgi:hypothetical protein
MSSVFKRGFSTEAWSTHLKSKRVADLKVLAIQSGINCSGNKSDLVHRLVDQWQMHQANPRSSSVLSFDVGYRNLAYCHLTNDARVLDWARVDLDLPSYHPSVVAPVVRQFIQDKVQHNISATDRVVIELQRARTAGAHSVLESTLRVNCVEALLWCGLYEAADKTQRPQLPMMALARQNVDRVWQQELDAVVEENAGQFSKIKMGYYRKKQAGAALVQKWLDTNTVIQCDDRFKAMFDEEKKKDDLSDCLIQALSWYKWEAFSREYVQNNFIGIDDNDNKDI